MQVKFRIPEIFLGAFLAVAIFAMGMTFESSRYPPSQQSAAQTAQYEGSVETADKSPNITDWLIAGFSGLLVVANIFLWIANNRSAIAAKSAVEALPIVERAYVYPVVVGHGAIGDCIENARVFYLDDPTKDDVPAAETAEITFKFKNFGKTPAILKTAFAGVGVAPLGAQIGLPLADSVLGAGEETATPLVSKMEVGITRTQAQHILAYTRHVCFEGKVTFDDIWGNEHTTEFYFVWDHWISRMNLRWVETKTKHKGERPKNEG
jgi:hypothetical protein